jgi:hypothetical protein
MPTFVICLLVSMTTACRGSDRKSDSSEKDDLDADESPAEEVAFRPQAGRYIRAEIVPFQGKALTFVYDTQAKTLRGFEQTKTSDESSGATACNARWLPETLLDDDVVAALEAKLESVQIQVPSANVCEAQKNGDGESDGDRVSLQSFADATALESNDPIEEYPCGSIEDQSYVDAFKTAAEATGKLEDRRMAWNGMDYEFSACQP